MDSVCLGSGMASVFFIGKGRFLVLFSLCTPHLPLSKQTPGPGLGVRKCVFQSPCSEKCWPHDHGQILPLSDISFCIHKMRRTAEVADVLLSISVASGFCEPGWSIFAFQPLSHPPLCVGQQCFSWMCKALKRRKVVLFIFFLCAVYQMTLMWWTTGSGDTAHWVLFNTLPERKEGMDLLTCDFDSGLCIRPIIMWND